MANIDATLAERGGQYGSFADLANVAVDLKRIVAATPGWARMAPDQREATRIILNKFARMLNGDPDYRDNWHDIVGYAKLVDDRMAADEAAE